MEEYIAALILIIILYWYFNIHPQNNCIVMSECDPLTKMKKFLYDDFRNT